MKKYIFITAAIFIFILFASCSSDTSSKCESNCFEVQAEQNIRNIKYRVVTYEDRVKMKRYTFVVCTKQYGCGCTLIDTDDIK